MIRSITFSLVICFFYCSVYGQQLIEIKPISENVILVHFDEGYAIKHEIGEAISNESVIYNPLDVIQASLVSNYTITSSLDPNFSVGTNPQDIYRKSKGTDFINICEAYTFLPEFGVEGCDNTSPDHAKEHWIYLSLPSSLVSGADYSIAIAGFDYEAIVSQDFDFVESDIITPSIHVNNLGYNFDSEAKYAYVYHWMGDGGALDVSFLEGNSFQLIDLANNEEVFSGTVEFRKDENTIETFQMNPGETPNQNFNRSMVYECDFSSFSEVGNYKLVVEGVGSSFPFELSCNAIRPAFHAVMNGITKNRSGITLASPVVENDRPAPHHPGITPGFEGNLKYTTTTLCDVSAPDADPVDQPLWNDGIVGDLDSWGWYQDAGDWDAYPSHMEVAIKLMFIYDQFSENFSDNQLLIPEINNAIPDIMDEARWLPRFYKRLKDECEEKNYTSGGVPGARIFGDLWGEDAPEGIGIGSWQDNDRWWIVSGEDPFQTFLYAGACAQLALTYSNHGIQDPEGIDWQTEAIESYSWANNFYNPTSFCHSESMAARKNYAAASLLMLTGNENYNTDFISSLEEINIDDLDEYSGINAFGGLMYALGNPNFTSPTTLAEVKMLIEQTADFQLLTNIDLRSCRFGGNHYFPMLSGHGTTPYVFSGIMGYALLKEDNPTKAEEYMKSMETTADYFLGTNPLNMTWIMGVGEKNPEGVFHIDSWYNENTYGYIPYGPWKQETYFGMGPFHHQWPEKTQYPDPTLWPGHERWFNNTESPVSTEFTIYQNLVNAAALYGALSGEANCTEVISGIGSQESSEVLQYSIYPNPSSDLVHVVSKLAVMENLVFLNELGSVVDQINVNRKRVSLDISGLKNGIYFIVIDGTDGVKFVKE